MLLEIAVVSELDVAQEVPTNGITAASLQQQFGVQHIAEGFAHLLALTGEEAMAEHLLRHRQSCRHAHGRPEHSVEAKDVLADHVHGGGPTAGGEPIERYRFSIIKKRCEITQKGIKPDVEGVAWMVGDRKSPGHIHPRNGEVAQTLSDEVAHFLSSAGWGDEVIARHQLLNGGLIAGEPKEQVLLIAPLERLAVDRTGGRLRFGRIVLVFLAIDAVPAGLLADNDVAGCLDPFVELFHQFQVARVGGAHKAIVRNPPLIPEIAVPAADLVAVVLGAQLLTFCRALNLLAVLINTGHEGHLLQLQPLKASQGITGQGRVSAAQMGTIVDVIERSRKGVRHQKSSNSAAPQRRQTLTSMPIALHAKPPSP